MKKTFNWIAGPLAVAGFGLLLFAESKRPLRKATSNKLQRAATNTSLSAVTAIAVRLLFLPVVSNVSRFVQKKRMGLLNLVPMPKAFKFAAEMLLLDYTFYWWHRFMHRSALLWRCHLVHHTDLDLD